MPIRLISIKSLDQSLNIEENKIYKCLYPNCNSIPKIQLNEGHIEFNCEKNIKK